MWARRCGAPRRWPSRIKVLIFTLLDGGIGLSIYLYMAGSNISYLDLTHPADGPVLCLTKWPETGHEAKWNNPPQEWFKWYQEPEDQQEVLQNYKCTVPSLVSTKCSNSSAPIMDMARPVHSPMQSQIENLRFDVLGLSARVFLTLAIFIWAGMAVHDLALIGNTKKNFILDVSGVNKHIPVIRAVWRCLAGVRALFRVLEAENIGLKVLGIVFAIILAPVIVVWNLVVFNFVICPIILLAFVIYPVRMCRAWVFMVCVVTFLYGIALTCLMIGLAASHWSNRPYYAVTWDAGGCTCGCDFPVSFGVCMNLAVIGIGTALKSLFVALRCLKGLRRSQWANLLSVVFPVPLTVYAVDWKQKNGQPIKFRDDNTAVQEEVAFDPFAMMDEQLDSAFTTVNLQPESTVRQMRTPSGGLSLEPSRKNMEAPGIRMPKTMPSTVQIVESESEYIGCCGFPWPTGGTKGVYLFDEDNEGNSGQQEPARDPEPDVVGASSSQSRPDASAVRPKDIDASGDQNPDTREAPENQEPSREPKPTGRGTSSSDSPPEGPVPQPKDQQCPRFSVDEDAGSNQADGKGPPMTRHGL